jgi:hypothetical protein
MMGEGDRAPTQERIHVLTNIDGLMLAVTYTPGLAYQFQVVCPPPDDDIYQDESIYYTPAAAEQAGRAWIQRVFGYPTLS